MKLLLILIVLLVGGSSLVVEEPEEKTESVGTAPIEVVPYYTMGTTPAGLKCMELPEVSFRWADPVGPGGWSSDPKIPEIDYCGYNPDGMRICCPK